MQVFLRNLTRSLRRGALAVGTGVFMGLIAAFGLVAPVFVQNPVVHATPADALPPCPAYQALLDQNLSVLRAKDADIQRPVLSTFDYARLALYPDGQAKLDAARKELLDVRPSRLGPQARVAWAINLHNFLVIDAIVKYGFPGGRPVASVRDITIQDKPFFEAPITIIEGQSYSLDGLEKHFLLGDFDRSLKKPPPSSLDPRVHFALSNGARGSAPLLPQAYRPENLDFQLDNVTRGALLGSKHLRWHGMTRELAASRIFQWYAADFGGDGPAYTFLLAHVPARTSEQLRAVGFQTIPEYIDWDWTLNQGPSR